MPKLTKEAIDYLETRIDAYIEEAPELECFILPGGSPAAATVHIARTVTRRAERQVVKLMKADSTLSDLPLQFLNRLSDYFFALARVVNFRLQVQDVQYVRSAPVFRDGKRKATKENEDKKMLSLLALFIALSAVGAAIKIPAVVGSVALDASPALLQVD